MTNNEYRKQWLSWHRQYERQAFSIFRKAIRASIAGMPISHITYDNYKKIVPLNTKIDPIKKAYIIVYREVGSIHGRRVGKGINREIKNFNNDLFNKLFQTRIIKWIREHGGKRIISVTDTIAKKVMRLIEISLKTGLSTDDMQKSLRKSIDDPSFTKVDAMRIARTETTTATNYSATIAGESAGIVLEKFWIATEDQRTRRGINGEQWDHYNMDGISVGQFDKFHMTSVTGIKNNMLYPGDPAGDAGNVINCRCTIAYRPKRDSQGFVIQR